MKKVEIKPLSSLKYFINNRKKSLVITFALALSVFMVLIFQMVVYAVNEGPRLGDVGKVDNMTQVHPGGKGIIDKDFLKDLSNNPLVDSIIPTSLKNMKYYHFFGTANMTAYFMSQKDISSFMKKKNMELKQGRLPEAGKNEIILEWRLANNLNKKIGDYVGKEVDRREEMTGKYKVVGTFKGSCIVGLSAVNESQVKDLESLLVFPKEGQLDKLNSEFRKISNDKAKFWTLEQAEENYIKSTGTLSTIFNILSIVIIFVMAFASGNSSYAQYFSRRYEFGLLQSIGYTKAQILIKAAKEITLLNSIGFVVGILLGLGVGEIMQKVFFEPHGFPFLLMQPGGVIRAFTIPVCTTLFGLIPAGWLLSRLDPMLTVEKFE